MKLLMKLLTTLLMTLCTMIKKRESAEGEILKMLKRFGEGLTITELVNKTNLNRSAIRTVLAKLDGADKVSIKKIGMAKVYSLGKKRK